MTQKAFAPPLRPASLGGQPLDFPQGAAVGLDRLGDAGDFVRARRLFDPDAAPAGGERLQHADHPVERLQGAAQVGVQRPKRDAGKHGRRPEKGNPQRLLARDELADIRDDMQRGQTPAVQRRDVGDRRRIVAVVTVEALPERRIGPKDQSAFASDQECLSAEHRPGFQNGRGQRDAAGNDQHIAALRVAKGLRNRPDRPSVGIDIAPACPPSGIDDPLGDAR